MGEIQKKKKKKRIIIRKAYRFDQTVSTAFIYEALVDRWWHPHTGEGPGLTRVPALTLPSRKTGRAVTPERLTGTTFFIHQDHGGVDELASAR